MVFKTFPPSPGNEPSSMVNVLDAAAVVAEDEVDEGAEELEVVLVDVLVVAVVKVALLLDPDK